MLSHTGSPSSNAVCQCLLHCPVHLTAQLPRAVGRSSPGSQCRSYLRGVAQPVAAASSALLQLAEHFFCNGAEVFLPQRTEHDHFIQPPEQLWAEPLFCFLHSLRGLLFKHGFCPGGKAQRRVLPCQKPCAQVGSKQHDGVAEIRLAPHGIGQLTVLQNLQQDILDIRVCLFDLVKQHHAVRAAAHSLGQLPALIVAEVARRRAQQPGSGVLLLILRHIELEQRFLAAEPADCQRPCQCGLSHAGRA